MDLTNAITKIQQLSNDALRPLIMPAEYEPDDQYYIFRPDLNQYELVTAGPKLRRHQFSTLESIGDFLRHLNKEDTDPRIWISICDETETELNACAVLITLIIDDSNPTNRGEMKVHFTKIADHVIPMSTGESRMSVWRNQTDFVRYLRYNLDTALSDSGLLQAVQDVRFSLGANTEGSIQHGRESITRSQLAELKGTANALPEEIYLEFRLFREVAGVAKIRCMVDCNPKEMTFRLCPFPDLCEAALIESVYRMVDKLETFEPSVPVFFGSCF